MGERLSDEEMDEFLGWLGLRGGGSINLVTFKKLPCWQPEAEAAGGNSPKRTGILSHFSQVPRPSSALSRTVVSTLRALRALLTTAASRAPCASTVHTPEQTLRALQARDVPKGTVSVRVVRGAGLLAADSGGTSDPYVLVSVPTRYDGGNTARTSAKKKTLNPG